MPDLSLQTTTPLGGEAPRSKTYGAVTIIERTDIAIASLTRRRGATDEEASVMGLLLPAPGELTSAGGLTAFWSAPDQWMILKEGGPDFNFASEVKAAAPNASVTEQTDGFVVIDLISNDAAAPLQKLLEKLVNLDPERLAPGCATRTLLEHLSVFLVRHSQTRLTVFAMRSAAQSLWHALTAAAALSAPNAPDAA